MSFLAATDSHISLWGRVTAHLHSNRFQMAHFRGLFLIAVGDLNGDKLLDAVGADSGAPGSQGGSIDVFPGMAGGGFGPQRFSSRQ